MKVMKTGKSLVIGALVGLVCSGVSFAQENASKVIADWPANPKKSAEKMIAKYGKPQETTATMLVWHNNGPWKKTTVGREESPHDFPKPHTDLMLQTINYRVPPEKFALLAAYDGSVTAHRTKGELSALCDNEEANFLALNLAHDIIIGKRTPEEARKFYTDAIIAKDNGAKPPYTQALQFEVPKGNTGDRDKVTIQK